MATVRPLRLLEGNDELVVVTIGGADGQPYNLAGATVEMIIKPTTATTEGAPDASVLVLSTATGEITVTDAAAGTVTIDVDAADLATPGARTYRVDVIDGTGRRTAIHGDLLIVDL